ncbi:unnamed protein product [Trifolium pratense]|uniref:Uncharacterized protein n=1 Tax=Trifolium pratense TaxID=57577 RepID=A0ACB0LHZ3_TRIPR|nr:unnamed protein product [Trifolium pratense]
MQEWYLFMEGFTRLWRGTNAGLALAVLTVGIYLPCYDIFRNWFEEDTSKSAPTASPYVPLWLVRWHAHLLVQLVILLNFSELTCSTRLSCLVDRHLSL